MKKQTSSAGTQALPAGIRARALVSLGTSTLVSRGARAILGRGACATAATLFLACSPPAAPIDGKAVAISPKNIGTRPPEVPLTQSSGAENQEKSTSQDQNTLQYSSKLEFQRKLAEVSAKLTVQGFAAGNFNGEFVQLRCGDGMMSTTTISQTRIAKKVQLYANGTCDESAKTVTNESVWEVTEASGQQLNLKHTEEWRTVHSEQKLVEFNEKAEPCADGWILNTSRNISNLGTCALENSLFTLLALYSPGTSQTPSHLHWGSNSTKTQSNGGTDALEGSTAENRHELFEEAAFIRAK